MGKAATFVPVWELQHLSNMLILIIPSGNGEITTRSKWPIVNKFIQDFVYFLALLCFNSNRCHPSILKFQVSLPIYTPFTTVLKILGILFSPMYTFLELMAKKTPWSRNHYHVYVYGFTEYFMLEIWPPLQ